MLWDPTPPGRDVPIGRGGVRGGDRRRGGGRGRRRRRRLDPRHGDADRADDVRPAATRSIRRTAETKALWKEAGTTDPPPESDIAEISVPFWWLEPMWLENLGFAAEGDGWKVTEAGETPLGGRLPVNPSGGVL